MDTKEAEYSVEIIKNQEDIPERFKDRVKEGEMLLNARSLTTDFLPSKWLKELAEDSYNHRILYRHKDPESEKNRGRVYGRILESEITKFEGKDGKEKEAIDKWYRIFGDTEMDKKLQEYIVKKHEKKDPIGISSGYIVSRKNGEIVRVIHLEDSITHAPECKQCVTQEIISLEEKKDENMSDEELDAEADEEIKALQDELDNHKLQLEEKDSLIKKLEEKVEEFGKIVEKKDEEKLTLEDKLLKLNDELKEAKVSFEAKIDQIKKDPILEQIEKLEKDLGLYQEDIFEFEKKRSMEWIQNRLQELKTKEAEPKITTISIEEERKKLEEEEKEADVGTEVAFRGNPELKRKILKYQKEGMI